MVLSPTAAGSFGVENGTHTYRRDHYNAAVKASFGGVVLVVLAACSFKSPVADDGPTADAAPDDAAIDAAPFVCSFPGVQCPGNQPLVMLTCGVPAECWVGCVNGDLQTFAQAMQFCTNLGMTIGAFDSAADETCVRNAGINGSIMLGITQLANQLNPDEGWIRLSDNMPAPYVNWDTGQPNDGTAGENGEEQCAASNSMGRWQDVACAALSSARWICRRP
jgi:hypothetical protein